MVSTFSHCTLVAKQITEQMIYRVIIFPLSCKRCQKPTELHPIPLHIYWNCYWIRTRTGPLSAGTISSKIFSGGSCPLYSRFLRHSHGKVHFAAHSSYPIHFQLQKQCWQTTDSLPRPLNLGLPNLRDQSSLPILKRVQAGIKRARLGTTSAKVRLPVTPPLLRQLRQYLDATAHKERVAMWAICCMAFFGCFRLGELLLESPNSFDQQYQLTWGDVAVDSQTDPRMLRIHLKQLKTNQFHRGADIVVGRTGTDLWPVAAVLSYIASRGPEQGTYFLDSQAHPIAKTYFIRELRKVISALGLPQEQFAGHSFRIGAATSAAMAGVEDLTIQLLERWSSAAFLRYIRTPPEQLALLSATLASHEANR